MFERHFEAAIALLKPKTIASRPEHKLDTTTKAFLVTLGYCEEWAGRPNEARVAFEEGARTIKPSANSAVQIDSLGLPYLLALAYAGVGDREKALHQAKQAVSDYATDAVVKPNAEAVLAQIQARFGETDAAIAAVPHLLEVPAGITMADLHLNPFWDPLRKDPRFQKLIADEKAKSKP